MALLRFLDGLVNGLQRLWTPRRQRKDRVGMARQRGQPVAAVTFWCFLRAVAAQYDSCTTGAVANIGNGQCDAELNVPSCGYDGGDVSFASAILFR